MASGIDPLALLGGGFQLGSGIYSLLEGNRQQAKAKQANEERYRSILDILRMQGLSTKSDIRRSGEEERGSIAQSLVGRGLYNSTVLDTLNNQSRDRESRQMQAVDENVANRVAGFMESRTDAYPDLSSTGRQMAGLGASIGELLGGVGGKEKKASSMAGTTAAAPVQSTPEPLSGALSLFQGGGGARTHPAASNVKSGDDALDSYLRGRRARNNSMSVFSWGE